MPLIPPGHRDSRLCEGGALIAFLMPLSRFSNKTGQKTPASLPMVIGGRNPNEHGHGRIPEKNRSNYEASHDSTSDESRCRLVQFVRAKGFPSSGRWTVFDGRHARCLPGMRPEARAGSGGFVGTRSSGATCRLRQPSYSFSIPRRIARLGSRRRELFQQHTTTPSARVLMERRRKGEKEKDIRIFC
jgi:hypothetical protein